jgi:hypothetical protein
VQHGHRQVVVLLERPEGVPKLGRHRAVHGVAPLRSVERDGADGFVDVKAHVIHGPHCD